MKSSIILKPFSTRLGAALEGYPPPWNATSSGKLIANASSAQCGAGNARASSVSSSRATRPYNKQAAITIAEGEKQSAILRAEGERQARILTAEGFALALEKIFGAAKTIDAKTMSLQYLDALKSLGGSPATKFIFPMEFTQLLKPFIGYAGESMQTKKDTP